jgi:hypothetical protein
VLLGPGTACREVPAQRYTVADLRKAVKAGMLEKRKLNCFSVERSTTLEIYGIPTHFAAS